MSKKIEKLTPEQEAKFPEYIDKWIKVGTNTDRLDPDKTRKTIDGFRKLIGMEVDVPMFIVDNPIEAWVCCALVEYGVKVDDVIAEMKEVFNGNPKEYEIPKASLPYQTGSLFVSTFSFYDYMLEELDIEVDAELYAKYKTWEATAQLGCIYPLESVTFVSQKPTEIHLNEENKLHRDGGPALTYAGLGDFKVYSLNGVTVPEYLAVTESEQIDLEYYNTLKNADIRAEFVRKLGIERFIEKGKVVDSYKNYDAESHAWWHKSEYELIDMESLFEGLDYAPFIKMLNQTTGIWHMEGVSPDCKTVGDALKERFGGRDFVIRDIA
jgi:hypothetical protein